MISYRENPKDSLKTLINEFSIVAGYKNNIQKLVVSLCTNNKLPEKKKSNTITFTITSKRIQYLAINLTMKMKDQYTANYKTLMK